MGRGGAEDALAQTDAARRGRSLAHLDPTLLAGEQLPEREISVVWHLGSLRIEDKGSRYSESYEGHGLSISLDPGAWAQIARLGGAPKWELKAPQGGGRFLDAHSLSEQQWEEIREWAVSEGLCERVEAWQAVWWDDEMDDEMSVLLQTEEEARLEADEFGEVRAVQTICGTSKLQDRLGMKSDLGEDDHLLVVWAEDCAPELCGVWWDDELQPHKLSAPRGVILPAKLPGWSCERAGG